MMMMMIQVHSTTCDGKLWPGLHVIRCKTSYFQPTKNLDQAWYSYKSLKLAPKVN